MKKILFILITLSLINCAGETFDPKVKNYYTKHNTSDAGVKLLLAQMYHQGDKEIDNTSTLNTNEKKMAKLANKCNLIIPDNDILFYCRGNSKVKDEVDDITWTHKYKDLAEVEEKFKDNNGKPKKKFAGD